VFVLPKLKIAQIIGKAVIGGRDIQDVGNWEVANSVLVLADFLNVISQHLRAMDSFYHFLSPFEWQP
jgi:hypothetical protein